MNILQVAFIHLNASRVSRSRARVQEDVAERVVNILILSADLLADLRRHPEMTPPGVEQRVDRIYRDVESALRQLTN